jgi:hypothetical protein
MAQAQPTPKMSFAESDLACSLRFVETTLANDEYSSDDEMCDHLIKECPLVNAELIAKLIEQERSTFFTEPLHTIDWSEYGFKYPYPPQG